MRCEGKPRVESDVPNGVAPTVATDWTEANRLYLMRSLGRVRNAMRRAVESGGEGAATIPSAADDERAVLEAAVALPAPSAIETLAAAFGLSPFERDVLLLCAGVELDSRFAADCLGGRGDGSPFPTFGQAMAALPGAHWSAWRYRAPRRWRLIELGDGVALSRTPLRIDERIVHYLTGIPCLDQRLHGLLTPVISPGSAPLPPSLAAVARRAAGLWGGPAAVPTLPVVLLCGEAESGKRPVAAAACADLGLALYAVRAEDLPAAPSDRETLATLCDRESRLEGYALLIECDHDADGPPPRPVIALAERLDAPLLIAARDPVRLRGRPTARLDVNRGDAREQRDLWAGAVGPAADRLDGRLDGLAAQFHLDAESIQSVGASVLAEDPSAPGERAGGPALGRLPRPGPAADGQPGPADRADRHLARPGPTRAFARPPARDRRARPPAVQGLRRLGLRRAGRAGWASAPCSPAPAAPARPWPPR